MNLWHFTCEHGYQGIGRRGLLRPRSHPFLPTLGPCIWLTDHPSASRDDLGLTSRYLVCDRTAYRYRVAATEGFLAHATPWADLRDQLPAAAVADLERFADPSTWWLSFASTKAVLG